MSQKTRIQLGWIGFGNFGEFAVAHLRDHFEVHVADREDRSGAVTALGARWSTIAEAAACSYVVIAVPVQELEEAVAEIRPHVQPGSLLIDVGSVKVVPTRQMLDGLPDNVEILGTHPMFGPQSADGGLAGKRIVLCPVRTERVAEVQSFLEGLELEVIVTDAETHDREIARTQALAQYVGRTLALLEESESPIRTPAYEHLLSVANTVREDTWELFAAIENLNPYALDMRRRLLDRLHELEARLAADPSARARVGNAPGPEPSTGAPDADPHANAGGPDPSRGID